MTYGYTEGNCNKCLCKQCKYSPIFCYWSKCDKCTVLDEVRRCLGFVKAKRVEDLGK